MPQANHSARIVAAQRIVMAQTTLMQKEFGRVKSEWKPDGSRVTAADLMISAGIVRDLQKEFPDDEVFSEEHARGDRPVPLTKPFTWILDPIDGTNNYALGIPTCAISLALLDHGVPVYGVVYDLSRRCLIHGGPGYGLFDGDRPARVRSDPPNPQTVIGFHSPHDKRFAAHAQMIVENFKIRGLGSSTLHLAYVAVGILDGTVDHNVKVWDIAAGVPLCQAGGGRVEFLNGELFPLKEFDLNMKRIRYIAGNAAICDRLRAVLRIERKAAPVQGAY
ncbi:MAG: inositol monophosphatase [Verrucomicrobia bacterium]|nr:inositol monophosphatase [Verrucomicrobiota bacterium]